MCGAPRAAALLPHVNLLLTLYGGAALATAARLKWDPSTYVGVRELFPAEYRGAAAALAALGAALPLLAHLAALALLRPPSALSRRVLLLLYAAVLSLVLVGELAFGAWLWLQVSAWLRSEAAAQLGEALALREHLRPLLAYLARWHPLPQHLEELIAEAEEDVPRNGYCAAALGALLLLLQPLGVALALLAARRPPSPTLSQLCLRPGTPTYRWGRCWSYRARCLLGVAEGVTYVIRITYREKVRGDRSCTMLQYNSTKGGS